MGLISISHFPLSYFLRVFLDGLKDQKIRRIPYYGANCKQIKPFIPYGPLAIHNARTLYLCIFEFVISFSNDTLTWEIGKIVFSEFWTCFSKLEWNNWQQEKFIVQLNWFVKTVQWSLPLTRGHFQPLVSHWEYSERQSLSLYNFLNTCFVKQILTLQIPCW